MRHFELRLGILLLLTAIVAIVQAGPIQLYNDPEFLNAEIRRIQSGDPIQPPLVYQRIKDQLKRQQQEAAGPPDSSSGSYEDGEGDDENYYEDSDEIEVTCARGKGWHWRVTHSQTLFFIIIFILDHTISESPNAILFMKGQRCVPYHCPGGSSERDFNTGECIHSFQSQGRHKPYSQWNSLT
jgi:hypothetical protein